MEATAAPGPGARAKYDEPEVLECARYGEPDELAALLQAGASPDYTGYAGNTALHMASANGFAECVSLLIEHGAKFTDNESGNSPLHWAVLNKHLDVTKILLKSYDQIDVLAKNTFGKSALTEAFGASVADITQIILEHKSAAALEKKKGGGGGDAAAGGSNSTTKGAAPSTAASSRVVQEHTHVFNFGPAGELPADMRVREVATDWTGEVFTKAASAEDDTTGMQVWATSLVFARWVVALQQELETRFAGRAVLELGAGAGVPGLAAALYSDAATVTLTDLFPHTLENLRHNLELNKTEASAAIGSTATEVKTLDWTDYSQWPAASYGVVLGSDLVYEAGAAELVCRVVDHMLAPAGTFYMIAGDRRQGVPELVQMLEKLGYAASQQQAPAEFLANPLKSNDDDECRVHFNELEDNTFTLHSFIKPATPSPPASGSAQAQGPGLRVHPDYSPTRSAYGPCARSLQGPATEATAPPGPAHL